MNLPLAPILAALVGVGVAGACLVMPTASMEELVVASGVPAVLSAAEPPLGMTARLLLGAGAGGLIALFTWFGLYLMFGTRGFTLGETVADETVPSVRRADAHPDAPPRAPLMAIRDLGTPFLEVTAPHKPIGKPEPVDPFDAIEALFPPEPEPKPKPQPQPEPAPRVTLPEAREPFAEPLAEAPEWTAPPEWREPVVNIQAAPAFTRPEPAEQDLPADLEQPLAAFDPLSIPDVPMPPPVTLPPLRPRPAVFDSSERFETFDLTPMRRSPPPPGLQPAPRPPVPEPQEPIATPRTDATIHALLERLEQGVVRRGNASGPEPEANPRETERGLEDALVTLRNLARRA